MLCEWCKFNFAKIDGLCQACIYVPYRNMFTVMFSSPFGTREMAHVGSWHTLTELEVWAKEKVRA